VAWWGGHFKGKKEGVLFNVLCGDRVWICALAVVWCGVVVVVLVLVLSGEKSGF
jgi:hypothetical protein